MDVGRPLGDACGNQKVNQLDDGSNESQVLTAFARTLGFRLLHGIFDEFFQRAGFPDGAIILVDRRQDVEFRRRDHFHITVGLLLNTIDGGDIHRIGHRHSDGIVFRGDRENLVFTRDGLRQGGHDIRIDR